MKKITDEEFDVLIRIKEIGLEILNINWLFVTDKTQKEDAEKMYEIFEELNSIAVELTSKKLVVNG